MTYSMKIWNHPSTGQIRLYINGTNRSGVYFMQADDGRMVWSSKTQDTPRKYQSGNHYGKVNKDRVAAKEVAEIFGVVMGDGPEGEFDRAVQIAKDGIEIDG